MRIRNILLISLFFIASIVLFMMCTGVGGKDVPEEGIFTSTGLSRKTNIKEYGIPAQYIPFEYPVPDGLIENPAEREKMINEKIKNLIATNDVFWGELPGDDDVLLKLFQDIWSYINSYFPGFKGLNVNWDKFGEENYIKIEEGLKSYGEFAYILTQMAYILEEGHSYVLPGRLLGKKRTLPNAYLYKAPVFNPSNLSKIAACYTVTEDEKLVISKVWDGSPNPYNFELGDEIVGFNGVPWSEWIKRLPEAGIPIEGSPAASKPSIRYNLLRSGMGNVNLFEKINIKKRATGEIVTLPIVYLDPSPSKDRNGDAAVTCTELPYDTPGIDWKGQKPGNYKKYPASNPLLVYGKLTDTNIGYIFLTQFPVGFDEFDDPRLWDPYETAFSKEFEKAILSLMDSDGIILDLRLNYGGRNEVIYRGISHIIDSSKTVKIFKDARRDSQSTNRYDLKEDEEGNHTDLKPDKNNDSFKKPFIVMTGPDCISACDYAVAFFSKFPEFTIIGRDPNGSFSGVAPIEKYQVEDDFVYRYISIMTSFFVEEPHNYLMRRAGFVDIPTWFKEEDVAKGVDSMRIEAIELIKKGK